MQEEGGSRLCQIRILLQTLTKNIISHIKLHAHKFRKFEQIFIHLFIFRIAKIGILTG